MFNLKFNEHNINIFVNLITLYNWKIIIDMTRVMDNKMMADGGQLGTCRDI